MAESSATDIKLGRLNAGPTYLQDINELGVLLGNTANMFQKLKKTNQEFNSVNESAAMKEIKGCMEKDMNEVGKMAHTMKEKLGKILVKNVENWKIKICKMETAIYRSRVSLTIALKTKLQERKIDLQNLGKTIRQEYLVVIQRRTFTATGIKLSDEVISAIDTSSAVQMFENVLQGASPEQIAAAVDEIKERHAAATDFVKKILEVQQIFERMVALIELGEMACEALDGVQKLAEELRREMAKNDILLVFLLVMIGLAFFLCLILIMIPVLTSD